MSKFKDEYIQRLADALASDGEKLIKKAYNTANFKKDKTQNLHDSYGSAVYYKGKYVPGTKRLLTPRANKSKYNYYTKDLEYGFEVINKFLDTYKPQTSGLQLIIAVAMYYGTFLEKGSGRLKRKYRVITGINSDLSQLASSIGGNVIDINL